VTTKSVPARKKSVPAAKKAAVKKSSPPAKKVAAAPKTAAPTKKAAATKKAVAAPAPPRRPSVGPYAKEAKFLEEQRELLLEERAIYKGQALDLRAEADSLALEREPGDVQFDEESGEGGTVTVDRERNLALSAQASAAVEEIDDALRKIERKSYGGCERCHQAIPKARLRALPFARLCVACKSGGLSRR
jgi:DnaK suppressor protein